MFNPREWFNRGHDKASQTPAQADGHQPRQVPDREVREFWDPYESRSMVDAGDRVIMEPGQVLENVHHLMERMDLEPSAGFTPEEAITWEECEPLAQMGLWDLIVTETAWSARRILAPRWPKERVEGHIAERARLDMFLDGPGFALKDGDEERAKAVLNRALASEHKVKDHPELAELTQAELAQTWFPLLAWYGIKCNALHEEGRRDGQRQ